MSKAVLYMSMSLDGFVAGPNVGPGNGLGDGGHRLHEWFLTGAGASHKGAAGHLAGRLWTRRPLARMGAPARTDGTSKLLVLSGQGHGAARRPRTRSR